MSAWSQGAAEIGELLDERTLSRLQDADAGVPSLMARARQQLASAKSLVEADPATAFVIAYDAAKHAGLALLAEQNLRPTQAGGHVVIERALRAQFGGVFSRFNTLRRRRNELDYPTSEEDFADADEACKAIRDAEELVESAQKILDQGVLTTF